MTELRCLVEIVETPLSVEKYVAFVSDPTAGAISTFSGVTRNSFNGKTVTELEYEAYESMALKVMKEIAEAVDQRWTIVKVAMGHRIGTVAIEETSVVIAVSSEHRQASLEACAWAIDELKARVPIWKKEHYADGSVWKENKECIVLHSARQQLPSEN